MSISHHRSGNGVRGSRVWRKVHGVQQVTVEGFEYERDGDEDWPPPTTSPSMPATVSSHAGCGKGRLVLRAARSRPPPSRRCRHTPIRRPADEPRAATTLGPAVRPRRRVLRHRDGADHQQDPPTVRRTPWLRLPLPSSAHRMRFNTAAAAPARQKSIPATSLVDQLVSRALSQHY